MKVLITGGAGYIGSTTALALEQAGHVPIILDSLVTGPKQFVRDRIFYKGDVGDRRLLRRVLHEHPDIEATLHMAARIVVTESAAIPYDYYRNNVASSLELFDELVNLGKPRILFSSSASVYAATKDFEVDEASPLDPQSPYARTKLMVEMAVRDIARATDLRAVILRYFNAIGADASLQSGFHAREPSHILGQLVMTALGSQKDFVITGTDHPTRDGTGLRDYIHVWDLAQAHVAALTKFDTILTEVGEPSVVINVGTGSGVTVRELIAAFERVCGEGMPTRRSQPRPGDAAGAFANVERAHRLLGWRSELSLDEAIESALAWGRRRRDVLGYD